MRILSPAVSPTCSPACCSPLSLPPVAFCSTSPQRLHSSCAAGIRDAPRCRRRKKRPRGAWRDGGQHQTSAGGGGMLAFRSFTLLHSQSARDSLLAFPTVPSEAAAAAAARGRKRRRGAGRGRSCVAAPARVNGPFSASSFTVFPSSFMLERRHSCPQLFLGDRAFSLCDHFCSHANSRTPLCSSNNSMRR